MLYVSICVNPISETISLMLDYPCNVCQSLLAKMRSAITEAEEIVKASGKLIHATKPSEHVEEWRVMTGRWETARRTWVVAAMNLKHHFATKHAVRSPSQEHH
jgi:hypothetical protein